MILTKLKYASLDASLILPFPILIYHILFASSQLSIWKFLFNPTFTTLVVLAKENSHTCSDDASKRKSDTPTHTSLLPDPGYLLEDDHGSETSQTTLHSLSPGEMSLDSI